MKTHSIKFKLGLLISLSIFIVSLILTLYSTLSVRKKANETARDNLQEQASKYAGLIKERIGGAMDASRTLAQTLSALKETGQPSDLSREQVNEILTELLDKNPEYFATFAAFEPNEFDQMDSAYANTQYHDSTGYFMPYWSKDAKGKLVWEPLVFYKKEVEYYHGPKKKMKEVLTSPAKFNIQGQRMAVISLSVPVKKQGDFFGVAGVDMTLDWAQDIVDDADIFDHQGRVSIISNNGNFAAVTGIDSLSCKPADLLISNYAPIKQALLNGQKGEHIHKDTLRVFAPLQIGRTNQPWQVVIEMPFEVVMASANEMMWTNILIGIVLASVALGFTIFFLNKMMKPIDKMVKVCREMAEGEVTHSLDVHRKDEIGDMAKAINKLINNLYKTGRFATEIGKGNLEVEHSAISEKDTMGIALIEMRDNLKKVKEEDEKRNWATQGQAKFGELLRQQYDTIDEQTNDILKTLVKYLDANQGGLYLLEGEGEEQVLQLNATYAWGRRKYLNNELQIGEGLAGQAVLEKDYIYLTDVPEDYINITSGLGKANPSAVLIMPLMINEEVFGVVELASFREFEKYQIEFVQKVGESIASTLSSVQVNEQTRKLLQESKSSSEELRAIEEELRQNQEELEATQEEMNRTIKALRDENEQLKKEQQES